jgi:DNA polymerase-4
MARSLADRGLATVGDIARADPRDLARAGPFALRLAALARGQDDRPVDPRPPRKSLSAETTFEADLRRLEDLEARLWALCQRVARHLRSEGLAGRTVTLKLRTADFAIVTRRRAAPGPTQTARTLFAVAGDLLRGEVSGQAYRLIGVGASDLAPADGAAELFASPESRALRVETTLDSLRRRFGDAAVTSGRDLKP